MKAEKYEEIKRRRQRKKKVAHLTRRAQKASASEKTVIAGKLRNLTPGADTIINRLELEEA